MPSSPTNVDAPLDYLTVDSYAWPSADRAKRFRLEAEARKLRHRENQRRFMLRKQARLATMRCQVEFMELQLKYLQALEEEQTLRKDELLLVQFPREQPLKARGNGGGPFEPLDAQERGEPVVLDCILSEVLLSL